VFFSGFRVFCLGIYSVLLGCFVCRCSACLDLGVLKEWTGPDISSFVYYLKSQWNDFSGIEILEGLFVNYENARKY